MLMLKNGRSILTRVSSIYCLFGSNKYKEAGEEAQRLLQDVETANELINKIK
jgi:hypothetical protein